MAAMSSSTYYEAGEQRAQKVGELFTRIARRYDLVNDIQSFGLHRVWKRRLIELLEARPGDCVLDLASGTGDLVRIGRKSHPDCEWFGLDFTYAMLCHGRVRGPMIQGDILDLPCRSASVSAMTMAYGMRNVADRAQAIAEVRRVLEPAGKFVFLDFAKPDSGALRAIFFAWLRIVQPLLGLVFFGDPETYRYILRSLRQYPEPAGISRELEQAGFRQVSAHRLFGGMMSIHVAIN